MKLTWRQKLPLYERLVWGALVLFSMVGACSGQQESAAFAAAIIVVMWVILRIVSDALSAALALYLLSLTAEEKSDDGEPPDEGTAT